MDLLDMTADPAINRVASWGSTDLRITGMRGEKMKMKLTLVGAAMLALASLPIQAATTEDLTLSDGLGDSITIDQSGNIVAGSGYTVISKSGSGGDITFLGTIGTFSFDLDSGQAFPGTTLPTLMNTTTINTESAGAGTLTITFSQTGYTGLAGVITESASDTYTANTPDGSTANFSGYDALSNALNSTANLIGTVLSSTDSSFPLSQSDAATHNYSNSVGGGSLTEIITLGFAGAGTIDTGFTISNVAVPEPASIVFLGTMVLGLTGLIRKKQAKRS
jgi:hypothetical protein